MKPLWKTALLIFAFLSTAAAPRQTDAGGFRNPGVDYIFGESATFTVEWTGALTVEQITLFVKPVGGETRVAEVAAAGSNLYQHVFPLVDQPLRPFEPVDYWFQARLDSGEETTSPVSNFEYRDNRVEWQHLQDGQLEVYWQEGELVFGQAALNTALAGMERVRSLLPFEPDAPIQIFVYPNATEWQSGQQNGQDNWFVGHATPDLGVAVVAVPPGPDEKFELERQIPHELMHIAQYQTVGRGYKQLPAWFSEGLASLAELYPNAEYQHAVEQAVQETRLLNISELCDVFPQEPQGAYLAYAQSAAFVEYLQRNFGTSGLLDLLQAYQNGLGCAESVQTAFGKSLDSLDVQWRRTELGVGELGFAFNQLSPYLLLLGLLIVPLVLVWTAFRPGRRRIKE